MNAIMGVKFYKKYLELYMPQKNYIEIHYTQKYRTSAEEDIKKLKDNDYEIEHIGWNLYIASRNTSEK